MNRILTLLFSVITLSAAAQQWVEGMHDHTVNFYDVQDQFEEYWKQVEREAIRTNQDFRPGKTGPACYWLNLGSQTG